MKDKDKPKKPVSESRNPKQITEMLLMRDSGATVQQVADFVGKSKATVCVQLSSYFIPRETLDEWRSQQNNAYSYLRQRILGELEKKLNDPVAMSKMSVDKLAWAAGSLQAQERLNEGKSTSIVEKQQSVVTSILKSRTPRKVIDAVFEDVEEVSVKEVKEDEV